MKKILTDAAAVGNAAGRMLNWRYTVSHPDWSYYPNSMWGNMLWEGGANFETPPPEFTKEGMFKPLPPTGARTLDSRTAFYYGYTLDSPGMIMRIPDVGSQYLMGFVDSNSDPYDGGKTYKVTLPKGIPARAFWSFTVYDNQSRSMLDTPQRYPAPAARAIRHLRPKPAPTDRRRSTLPRHSLKVCRAATGFRPCPARAGSRSCASIARWRRSLRKSGDRARLKWFGEKRSSMSANNPKRTWVR
jgi:hypothetical protein